MQTPFITGRYGNTGLYDNGLRALFVSSASSSCTGRATRDLTVQQTGKSRRFG